MQKLYNVVAAIMCVLGTNQSILCASEPQSAADCLPGINPTKDIPDSDEYELACLKKGFKSIWWSGKTVDPDAIREKEWNNNTFSTLKFYLFSPHEGIKKFDSPSIIVYRKNNERNALLLQKYLLESDMSLYNDFIRITTAGTSQQKRDDELSKLALKDNAYLVGTFLEYGEANIEYFYQYHTFLEHNTDNNDTDTQALAKKVKSWAPANQSKWKIAFDNDKNAYKEWLALNADISNATLKKQNAALSKTIEVLGYATR